MPHNSSNHILSVGCSFAISAAANPDTYIATWSAHVLNQVLGTYGSAVYTDATNGIGAASVTKSATSGTSGTAQTFTTDMTTSTYTILDESTANYTESTKIILCNTKFRWTDTTTNNNPRYTAIYGNVNSGNPNIFMGSYTASGTTSLNTLQPVASTPPTALDAVTQGTTG